MRVLLVKMSSLGDLVHTFPAVTDAAHALPDLRFDWLVEESFAEVPGWHPAVDQTIKISLRRWRRSWPKAYRSGQIGEFRNRLRERSYDLVIDAQGLLKSALPSRWARGPIVGYDRRSAREPLAALFYQRRVGVARGQHAIERSRQLFADALGYPRSAAADLDYGLTFSNMRSIDQKRLVFLHGTTWPSKHWPEPYWAELAGIAAGEGFEVLLPWGDPDDRLRAERIIAAAGVGRLLPKMGLGELARLLASADGVVGVDSGLAHLAAAVDVPTIVVYGPTDAVLTGVRGSKALAHASQSDCSPCLDRVCRFSGQQEVEPICLAEFLPARVWDLLNEAMRGGPVCGSGSAGVSR